MDGITYRVYEVWIVVRYQEASVVSLTPTNVFQSIEGYEDQADHYADGAVIDTAGDALVHPTDIVQAMLRDTEIGGNVPIADMDADSFDTAKAINPDLRFDFFLDRALSTEGWNDFCWQAGLRLHQNRSGQYQVAVFDENSEPKAYFTDRDNILVDRDGKTTFSP